MSGAVAIREERPADTDTIGAVIDAAFADMPYADGDEADLLVALRAAGALVLSLVAELEGEVVAQVTFSPAYPADGSAGWYALGPVAVRPDHQGEGIGAALIRAGLDELRSRDARGCILVGNPGYYARFGFRLAPAHTPPGQPAEYFQLLTFGNGLPAGAIGFHPAFASPPAADR